MPVSKQKLSAGLVVVVPFYCVFVLFCFVLFFFLFFFWGGGWWCCKDTYRHTDARKNGACSHV